MLATALLGATLALPRALYLKSNIPLALHKFLRSLLDIVQQNAAQFIGGADIDCDTQLWVVLFIEERI